MFKKFVAVMMVAVMLLNFGSVAPFALEVSAFDNFKVEVVKAKAPIREGYYESKDVIKWVEKGEILTVVGEKRNLRLNVWYKIKGGGYIYSGNVKKAHDHKVVFSRYGKQHPHYAEYACKGCDNGGYCSSETIKIDGCEKCYPKTTDISSKKENTNKVPNTNVTTPVEVLVPDYDSLQEEVEKNFVTPVHEHNYSFSHYSNTHPHYAEYKCSCGDSYQDTSNLTFFTTCNICYPPHQHNYVFISYEEAHPHGAWSQCSCGDAIYDATDTTVIATCDICYPYGYGNDHFCELVFAGKHLHEHPHYVILECDICGRLQTDDTMTTEDEECQICNNPFKDKVEDYVDLHGRVYDLSTGNIIYDPEAVTVEELYDFAEQVHASLDVLGLVPVVGEVFDVVNALYYIVEGDYTMAALSGAAVVPYIGIVSTSGKIIKQTGEVVIREVAEEAAQKVSKEIVEETAQKTVSNVADTVSKDTAKRLSKKAANIVNNYNKYPANVLKTIKDIGENQPIHLADAFYNGELLFSRKYSEVVTSSYSGLKYGFDDKSNIHRFYHILDKHAYDQVGKQGARTTYFNVNGKDVIDLIEDLYVNGTFLDNNTKTVKNATYTVTKTTYIIKADKAIGVTNDKATELYNLLLVVDKNGHVISAYPTIKEAL